MYPNIVKIYKIILYYPSLLSLFVFVLKILCRLLFSFCFCFILLINIKTYTWKHWSECACKFHWRSTETQCISNGEKFHKDEPKYMEILFMRIRLSEKCSIEHIFFRDGGRVFRSGASTSEHWLLLFRLLLLLLLKFVIRCVIAPILTSSSTSSASSSSVDFCPFALFFLQPYAYACYIIICIYDTVCHLRPRWLHQNFIALR